MSSTVQNRHDFILLFDVCNGNPNGDPDAGNLPRVDPESGRGLVTDVAIKRRIRNYVGLLKGDEPPYEIYVKERAILNKIHERSYLAVGAEDAIHPEGKRRHPTKMEEARRWMCRNFFDVRTFGAVMSTGVNCGQVRGPVQLTFASSIDPVFPAVHSIRRVAVTNEKGSEAMADLYTAGRKYTIPYGLYLAHGFISAPLAEQTGFSEDDKQILFEALSHMFEQDRSAARGTMTTRGLYIFKHESRLGNAPAHKLFELIRPRRRTAGPAQGFADYEINIPRDSLPAGIELLSLVE